MQFSSLFPLQWNPIIVRESRARWRGKGPFLLLLLYAGVLAIALFWRYADAHDSFKQTNPLDRIEKLGHELFLTLIWMQSLAWALIGPAITATAIAGEREAGLLEGVQLSPLTPWQILIGKLASALSFIALMLLVSVPITATCFLMGGVSPEDFLAAFALHATTAFTGAVLGLACSAWSRKANIAMRSAYVIAIVWLIGSSLSFVGVSVTTGMGAPLSWLWQLSCTIFGWSNPIIATAGIVDSGAAGSSGASLSGWGILETSPWLISIIFQLLLSGVLLTSAQRALKRPFAEQYWIEPKKFLEVPPANIPLPDSSASVIVGQSTPAPRANAANSHSSDWWLIPFFGYLSFLNPVLQRETRGKFRMRQPPLWVLIFELGLALFVGYFYLRTLWGALFIPAERTAIWWILNFIGLSVVALTAAVSGANGFTRERELKTWESLRMSLLSPREIVTAKLGAAMIGFAVFTLPFWPLLLPCIRHVSSTSSSDAVGISLAQALVCFGLLAATGICYTLWGMFWSWRSRKTTAATGWTLGTLFFALIFAPAFVAETLSGSDSNEWLWSLHPFVAMGFAADGKQLGVPMISIFALLMISGMLWLSLASSIERE